MDNAPAPVVTPGNRVMREVVQAVGAFAVGATVLLQTTPIPAKYQPALVTALGVVLGIKAALVAVQNLLEAKGKVPTMGANIVVAPAPAVGLTPLPGLAPGAMDLPSILASLTLGADGLPAHAPVDLHKIIGDAFQAGHDSVPQPDPVTAPPGAGPATVAGAPVTTLDQTLEHPAPAAAFDLAADPSALAPPVVAGAPSTAPVTPQPQ